MSTKLTYTGTEVQELLDKIEKGDFDNAKTLEGHPASYFAIASEFTSLAESFATEQGRVDTLYSYFNNGSANDALCLGGKLPSYYATATQYEILQRTLSDFKSLFDSMFEKDSDGNIHAKLSLWSSGGITAGSAGSGGSGGGGGISYSRLDSWADYSADKAGYVLSALLGKDLDNRVSALANAGYITASYLAPYALRSEIPSLVGYATQSWVGDNFLSKSGGTISDLIIDRNPSVIQYKKNGASVGYLGIGSELEPVVYNAEGNTAYMILHSGNYSNLLAGGTINGSLTATSFTGVINSVAPTALFRAMSYTAGQYSRSASEEDGKIFIGSSVNNKVISSPNYDGTNTAQNIQSLRLAYNSSFFTEIATTPNSNHLWKRNVEAGGANPWERFVTEKAGVTWNISITGNADSATKLQTPRSIWGQSFDGTGDISGNLSSNAWRIVTDNSTQGVFVQAKLGDGTSDAGRVFITGFNGANLSLFNVWSATTRIKGNVGIGIDYPSEALHVNGNGKFTGALTANSFIGNLTGNADSATKLATPRTLWGQSFDGTGNITGDIMFAMPYKIAWHNDKKNYYISSPTTSTSAYLEYNAYGGHSFLGGNVTIGGGPAYERLYVHGNGKFTGSVTASSLTIGGVTLTYDSVNEALCINGNMYALGGITAGGAGISAYTSLEARVARIEQQLNIS